MNEHLLSHYYFTSDLRNCRRLKLAMKALNEVGKAEQEEDLFTSMEVNGAGIQFKVINGGRILALFTMLPNSDMSSFNINHSITCGIYCSDFSDILERVRDKDRLSIFKIRGKSNQLRCSYSDGDATEKQTSTIVPSFHLKEAIEFNPQGQEPFCTIVIKAAAWRNGLLKLILQTRTETKTKGIVFEITRHEIKFYTGEYKDDTKSFTYKNDQENCHIKINDEANEHEYCLYMPLVEKPWTIASKLDGVGVMRLYYGNKVFMSLSFEQDPSRNGGSIMFVYYPMVFMDNY